jgi:hypothetical protein
MQALELMLAQLSAQQQQQQQQQQQVGHSVASKGASVR